MARILRNLAATIALAALLLVVTAWGFHADIWSGSAYAQAVLRFVNLLAVILWVGTIFIFNFVIQPKAPMGIFEGMADKLLADMLIWARHAAWIAIGTSLLLAFLAGDLVDGLMLKGTARVGGFGFWIMVLMALNLWLFIWPLQKRALRLMPAESDIRVNAAIVATLFSRINLMLALLMLYCMVTANLTDVF